MIKVAMQSVVPCAHDPREVLRGLNRILFRQLHDQLVSAAYLWLDTEITRHCIQRRGTRRFCAGGKVSWNASKAMACCLESSRIPTIPFVTCRSNQAIVSCFTPMA